MNMKHVAAILLCASLATASAQTTRTNAPPKGGLVEGVVAIGVCVVGCYCVIYAFNASDRRDSVVGPATLVLEKSEWKGPWEPVWTNTIPQCTTNKWVVFEERMGGAGCRYRVKTFPIP